MIIRNMQLLSDYENKITELNKKTLSVLQCGYWENTEKGIRTLRENGREDYQIIYVDKGALEIDGIRFKENSLYVFCPYEKQDYITAEDGTTYYWIHFCGTDAKQYVPFATRNFTVGTSFKAFVKSAVSEYYSKHKFYEQKVLSDFMSLMIMISRAGSKNTDTISKAVAYINNHYTKPLSNTEYAELCGLSESAFIRAFKKKTGKTPQEFRAHLMVETAKNLLLSTTMQISEIASLSGFEDSFYFSRVFKKKTGVSPSSYRKRL